MSPRDRLVLWAAVLILAGLPPALFSGGEALRAVGGSCALLGSILLLSAWQVGRIEARTRAALQAVRGGEALPLAHWRLSADRWRFWLDTLHRERWQIRLTDALFLLGMWLGPPAMLWFDAPEPRIIVGALVLWTLVLGGVLGASWRHQERARSALYRQRPEVLLTEAALHVGTDTIPWRLERHRQAGFARVRSIDLRDDGLLALVLEFPGGRGPKSRSMVLPAPVDRVEAGRVVRVVRERAGITGAR
jgi:hypothetical protein